MKVSFINVLIVNQIIYVQILMDLKYNKIVNYVQINKVKQVIVSNMI